MITTLNEITTAKRTREQRKHFDSPSLSPPHQPAILTISFESSLDHFSLTAQINLVHHITDPENVTSLTHYRFTTDRVVSSLPPC